MSAKCKVTIYDIYDRFCKYDPELYTKTYRELRGCTGKKQHADEVRAASVLREGQRAYKCDYCNYWHVGRIVPADQ